MYICSGSKVTVEYEDGTAPASPTREYSCAGSLLLAKVEGGVSTYYHRDHPSNRRIPNASGTESSGPTTSRWPPLRI